MFATAGATVTVGATRTAAGVALAGVSPAPLGPAAQVSADQG